MTPRGKSMFTSQDCLSFCWVSHFFFRDDGLVWIATCHNTDVELLIFDLPLRYGPPHTIDEHGAGGFRLLQIGKLARQC